jgi:hypothetical protein
MLTERYSKAFIADAVARSGPRSPFPPAADRSAWEGLLRHPLNRRRRDDLAARSAALLGGGLQALPLSGFAEFIRSGDRKAYECAYYSRRRDLGILVLSTCFSPSPATLEAASDAAWAICEETTWALPAHVERRTPDDPLPEIRRPSLDIFACETAAVLAEMVHLLRSELDGFSPVLAERIEGEILRRIIEPFEIRDDFWWLSGENNWTSWCVSAILLAACHVIRDPQRLAEIVWRCMEALDRFIARYPEDGCCDEGAMYWAASPGALLVALESLHALSGGRISIYDEPKIIAMAQYIGHIHLGGGCCFNYSDCPPRLGAIAARTYRFGERIGDDSLKDLALLSLRGWKPGGEPLPCIAEEATGGSCGALLQALRGLFWIPPDADLLGSAIPSSHWYPAMQVLVARSSAEFSPPIVMAAKGGTNGVCHNHNDAGSFTIHSSGCPVIVDVGNAAYSRQTFGSGRYGMWWNASRGHNVLQFSDHEQPPGAEFCAQLVSIEERASRVALELELSGAYRPEAGVVSWRRSCILKTGESPSAVISDRFSLKHPAEVKFPLFTPCPVNLGEGDVVFQVSPGAGMVMTWDPRKLEVAEEQLESDEASFEAVWGTKLRKLLCRVRSQALTSEFDLTFKPCRLPNA